MTHREAQLHRHNIFVCNHAPALTKNLRGGLIFSDDHVPRSGGNQKHLKVTLGRRLVEEAVAAGEEVQVRRRTHTSKEEVSAEIHTGHASAFCRGGRLTRSHGV